MGYMLTGKHMTRRRGAPLGPGQRSRAGGGADGRPRERWAPKSCEARRCRCGRRSRQRCSGLEMPLEEAYNTRFPATQAHAWLRRLAARARGLRRAPQARLDGHVVRASSAECIAPRRAEGKSCRARQADLSTACASSTSRTTSPGRTAPSCLPTTAPTSSRSSARTAATRRAAWRPSSTTSRTSKAPASSCTSTPTSSRVTLNLKTAGRAQDPARAGAGRRHRWSRASRRASCRRWASTTRRFEAVNPRLVMTSISNFGQTGPYRDYKMSEITLYALGGTMQLDRPAGPRAREAGPDRRAVLRGHGLRHGDDGRLHGRVAAPARASTSTCRCWRSWWQPGPRRAGPHDLPVHGAVGRRTHRRRQRGPQPPARRRLPDAGRLRAVLRAAAALGPHLPHDRPPGPDRRPVLHGAGELHRQRGGQGRVRRASCSSGCCRTPSARSWRKRRPPATSAARSTRWRTSSPTRTSRRATSSPTIDHPATGPLTVPGRAVPHERDALARRPGAAARRAHGRGAAERLGYSAEDIARLREQGAI